MSKNKYNTAHYINDDKAPDSPLEQALADIIFLVKDRLTDAIHDESTGLFITHPRVIISMVMCNILVNLMFNTITATDVKKRLAMLDESLAEIREMSIELWQTLEASRADDSKPQ